MADGGTIDLNKLKQVVDVETILDKRKLNAVLKTLETSLSGENISKYFKGTDTLLDDLQEAYKKFNRSMSDTDAKNLVNINNILKALKVDTASLVPNFEEIGTVIEKAEQKSKGLRGIIKVQDFKDVFVALNQFKEYGLDIEEIFGKLGAKGNFSELSKQLEQQAQTIERYRNKVSALRDELRDAENASGVSDLRSKLNNLTDGAKETFEAFLKLNNIGRMDEWGYYDSSKFSEYFDAIENGSMSAQEAITKFKAEYGYLLEDSFKNSNNTFGLEQLRIFQDTLDQVLTTVEDFHRKLDTLPDDMKNIQSSEKSGQVLFDEEQLKSVLNVFGDIKDHLSSLRSVISDVGDGEELSPLLKTIEKVSEAVSNLNMKFNMNIDVGSDNEMEQELQKKSSNALLAYENLREHLFRTYRGDNYTSELLYKFDPSQFDTTIGKIEGYKKFIENLRASIKENYGHDKLYEDSDKSYWNKASAAYGQITKVRNVMKADSEGSPLDNLFGSKTDLTEVIEQLKLIITELGNVSAAAAEIKTVLGNGIQINDSLQQIEALTQKVKELETELTSLKSGTSLPSTETNISSESSSMEQVQKSTDQAVQAKEDFAKANVGVQASVNESKSPLQLEAELMDKIAESARKAADAKKEFVKANGKVAASAKESNVSLNSDLTSDHSEVSEPTGIKKYQKKGYKAHDTGNHDNEKKVVNKKELGNALKELQSEIIANIDSANSFIKDVTDFYDSNDNLVKTQMKVLDKNGNMSTYTTSYSMDKDGNATAWTSHIDSQKFEDKNQEYQNQLKTIRELSAEKQKLQEQDRKSEVNQALKDQLYAYKQIQSIREKIASTDDENLIAELEKQKQTYQEQYLTATKILKNNSDLYNSESRLNELLQIGLKTTQKISEAEIKRNSAADNKKVKEWDDVNAKNQADIWKENQKAIQNYVNAVKKLQDLLAEDKGTGSKAAAIEKQQEKIKQLEEKALNARAILSSMVNPHTSDASTWDAWVKMMDKLSNASHDAKAAVDDVKKSIQAALTSEYKSMNDGLADYEAKMRSFNNRKPEDRRSDYSTALKNYTDALERYRNELQKIQNHPELINETEINNLKNMRQELDKAATSLKGIDKGSTAISRDKMINKISDYMKKNSAMSKEFKSELEGLIQKLKTLGAEADTTRVADEFFKITQRIREAGQEGKKFWDVVKEKAWYGLAGTIGTYFGFNDLIQYGKQGVQIVRELDTQLTEMMKVSNESAQSLKNYQNTTFDVADTVGTTAKQIQTSTADYMRLGESLDEAAESAKTANILLNVSEFSNIEDATKSLVAMGQAYKNLDKLTIVDKLNEVGKLIAQTYSNV
jgi:DNA repair exonuclease SbcCD ATPase subunit